MSPTVDTNPLFQKGDVETLFTDTRTLFEKSDFTFVNLECALTDTESSIEKIGPLLKATKNVSNVLKTLKVDCCGFSNNHIFDYGIAGARDTMAALDEVGIKYTGFGKNYEDSRKNGYYTIGDETICIIAVCEHEYSYAIPNRMGSRPYDPYDTMADIREGRKKQTE